MKRDDDGSLPGRLILPALVSILALGFLATSTSSATVITFDDSQFPYAAPYPVYQSLVWSNWFPMNGIGSGTHLTIATNGYYYGVVSASNVLFNYENGSSADVLSYAHGAGAGTNFDFLSVYLTGAWRSNLNIEVQAFRAGSLIYDQTVFASATNATLFTFNYLNVDRLHFIPSGGDNAGFGADGTQFVMDNFMFEFVPEPASLLLTAVGALLLLPSLKRRRGCQRTNESTR